MANTYGEPFTTAPPNVNDPGEQYAIDLNNHLNEITSRLESRVPFNALSGGSFDLESRPIEDAKYISFTTNSDIGLSPEGRLFYDGNEFWVVNGTGAIQLTSGLSLNAASLGGITGDYGGANPATLRFTDPDKVFRFYDDYGSLEWAYARALGFDVAGGVSSGVYCRIGFAGALTSSFVLPPDNPSAGRSVLVINNFGETFHNDATDTVSNDIYMDAGKRVKTSNNVICRQFHANVDTLVTGTWSDYLSGGYLVGISLGASSTIEKKLDFFDVGNVVTALSLRANKTSTGSMSWAIFKVDNTATVTAVVGAGASSSASGWVDISDTFTLTIEDNCTYILRVVANDASDKLLHVKCTFST